MLTPIYEAHAQLLVAEKPNIVTFQGVENEQGDERSYLETQYRLLRSRSLARRVISELGLWKAPTVTPATQPSGVPALLGRWREWIGMRTAGPQAGSGPSSAPSEAPDPGESAAESRAIDGMLSQLNVEPVRNTRMIEVTYESSDPQLAAKVVNTLTNVYINRHIEARFQASKQASAWLAEQLAEQRRKVEASELAVQQYRERENSLSLDAGQNIVVQRLNSLNSAVTQAKTELIAAEARYRQLSAGHTNLETLDSFPPIRANTVVQQIRARLADLQRDRALLAGNLGAKHPDMVRLDTAIAGTERELTTEIANTVESVRQEYLAALAREKQLTAALNSQKASALALNRQGIEYGVLLREVESNREIYQSLLQRANQTAVSSELKGSNIEIVDAAEVPQRPIRPSTRSNIIVGFLLSALAALAMAFVLEAFDSRIQTPSDVRKMLGLPFLGMLPYVSSRSLKGHSLVLSRGVPAAYAEACRSLRTNVLETARTKGTRSLLVTSASPGDGKSAVAVNLAVALGKGGSRVVVIDADMRRPTLHQLLQSEQRPGLSEVLVGIRKPSETIVTTKWQNVWLLPSGSSLSNPSELLGSRRFQEFLEKLSESFDWVIIDSPPVMAVTDSAVIARLAGGVLFVVNAQRTRRRVAQAALDRLETAGGTFVGAVLNAIEVGHDFYFNSQVLPPLLRGQRLDEAKRLNMTRPLTPGAHAPLCLPSGPPAAPARMSESWTRVIRPRHGLTGLDTGELWQYRELLVFFVWRNILVRYKQTTIGVAWAVVQPVLTMVVFTVIFGRLAQLPSAGVPYVVLTCAAVIPWQFFANGLSAGSNSIVAAGNIVRKVYFPRIFIPLSDCLSGGLDLSISLGLLLGLMVYYDIALTWSLLLLPLFALAALLTALGASLWLCALHVKYRDIKYVVPFLIQVGLYVSPVGFMTAVVPEQWRFWYHLNPLAGVIDGFRWAILGPAFTPDWSSLALSGMVTSGLLVTGLLYFRRTERTFADLI